MMSTRGHERIGFAAVLAIEHRDDHRDIGQMGAAAIGIVEHVGIAAPEPATVTGFAAGLDHARNAVAHAAQMHRDMRGIGDQFAGRIEQRAGKIEALLDVDRGGGGLQHDAHFLGNGHEQIVVDLQPDGIGEGPRRTAARQRFVALQDQATLDRPLRLPAGFDHRGRGRIDDQYGPHDRFAANHCGAVDGLPTARGSRAR